MNGRRRRRRRVKRWLRQQQKMARAQSQQQIRENLKTIHDSLVMEIVDGLRLVKHSRVCNSICNVMINNGFFVSHLKETESINS